MLTVKRSLSKETRPHDAIQRPAHTNTPSISALNSQEQAQCSVPPHTHYATIIHAVFSPLGPTRAHAYPEKVKQMLSGTSRVNHLQPLHPCCAHQHFVTMQIVTDTDMKCLGIVRVAGAAGTKCAQNASNSPSHSVMEQIQPQKAGRR